MGLIPIQEHQWKLQSISNFTGGMAVPPRDDTEASVVDNFIITRAGTLVTRPGTTLLNAASLGTAHTVGLGLGTVTPSGTPKIPRRVLFVIKDEEDGAYFADYYWNISGLSFTGPLSSPDPSGNPVKMESVDTAEGSSLGEYITIFACSAWENLQYCDGVNWGTLVTTPAATDPKYCRYVRLAGQRVYAAGNDSDPYTVWFSEAGDPESWPATNSFKVPASRGRITGLERQSGVLLIFTERCILQLQGDPPSNFKLSTIHENIGCPAPNTLSTSGAVTAFMHGSGFTYISGGLEAFGEKIEGGLWPPRANNLILPWSALAWGELTPNYYFFRTQHMGDVEDEDYVPGQEFLYMYDRNRFKSWVRFSYPVHSGLGSTNPRLCPILWVEDMQGLILAGGDGNLYVQPLPIINDEFQYYATSWDTNLDVTPGGDDAHVQSSYTSRYLTFGSQTMTKNWRRVAVGGCGLVGHITIDCLDADGSQSSVLVKGGGYTEIPFQVDSPSIEDPTRKSLVTAMRIKVDGLAMLLNNLDITWRPVRLSTRKHT